MQRRLQVGETLSERTGRWTPRTRNGVAGASALVVESTGDAEPTRLEEAPELLLGNSENC